MACRPKPWETVKRNRTHFKPSPTNGSLCLFFPVCKLECGYGSKLNHQELDRRLSMFSLPRASHCWVCQFLTTTAGPPPRLHFPPYLFFLASAQQGMRNGMTLINHPTVGVLPWVHSQIPYLSLHFSLVSAHRSHGFSFSGRIRSPSYEAQKAWRKTGFSTGACRTFLEQNRWGRGKGRLFVTC